MKNQNAARAGLLVFTLHFYLSAAYGVEYTGNSYNNPFFFEETEKNNDKLNNSESQGSMVLQGVLWNAEPPKAIVSGKIVTVGMKIGDAEVIAIDKSGVKMRENGKEFILKMSSRSAE